MNHCGAPGSKGYSCFCDAECEQQGDCCPDHAAACGGTSGPSCAGHCNSLDEVDGCYCDAHNAADGDCCPDYAAVCK